MPCDTDDSEAGECPPWSIGFEDIEGMCVICKMQLFDT